MWRVWAITWKHVLCALRFSVRRERTPLFRILRFFCISPSPGFGSCVMLFQTGIASLFVSLRPCAVAVNNFVYERHRQVLQQLLLFFVRSTMDSVRPPPLSHRLRAHQIQTLVANAGGAALARSLGGPEADWLALAEAQEREEAVSTARSTLVAVTAMNERLVGVLDPSVVGGDGFGGEMEGVSSGDAKELVLTFGDLEEGEKGLPPPSSSMKMGCPKIPQVGKG